jgi:hypothetical protein
MRFNHKEFPLSLGFESAPSSESLIAAQLGLANDCGRMDEARQELKTAPNGSYKRIGSTPRQN